MTHRTHSLRSFLLRSIAHLVLANSPDQLKACPLEVIAVHVLMHTSYATIVVDVWTSQSYS
eukprot:3000554-Amphidinium_carterae.1